MERVLLDVDVSKLGSRFRMSFAMTLGDSRFRFAAEDFSAFSQLHSTGNGAQAFTREHSIHTTRSAGGHSELECPAACSIP